MENRQVNMQGQEVGLGDIGGLRQDATVTPPQQPLSPPILTNEQFANFVASIAHDVACGDLPAEYIAHLPNPAILKAVLDIIDFESVSGLLTGGVDLSPKTRLMIGIGSAAVWAGYVVVKAQAIKNSLKKRGQYEEAMRKAAEEKKAGYAEILKRAEEMREHGAEAGDANSSSGS